MTNLVNGGNIIMPRPTFSEAHWQTYFRLPKASFIQPLYDVEKNTKPVRPCALQCESLCCLQFHILYLFIFTG